MTGSKLEALNLRHLSCGADRLTTVVNLVIDYSKRAWIALGEVTISKANAQHGWLLESGLLNATDPSHDTARIIRLPLVGMTFDMISWGTTWLHGWVDGSDVRDFRVPEPGYNPLTLKDAVKCKQCADTHLIVPEGYHVPPVNEALFEAVRGLEVQIIISPTQK